MCKVLFSKNERGQGLWYGRILPTLYTISEGDPKWSSQISSNRYHLDPIKSTIYQCPILTSRRRYQLGFIWNSQAAKESRNHTRHCRRTAYRYHSSEGGKAACQQISSASRCNTTYHPIHRGGYRYYFTMTRRSKYYTNVRHPIS